MKIIIDNQTKDLTNNKCLFRVYDFLNDIESLKDFTIFNGVKTIIVNDYVCYVRRIKNGFSFKFKNSYGE